MNYRVVISQLVISVWYLPGETLHTSTGLISCPSGAVHTIRQITPPPPRLCQAVWSVNISLVTVCTSTGDSSLCLASSSIHHSLPSH